MSINRLLAIAVGIWAVLVLASLGARMALFNAPLTAPEITGWVLIGCSPAAVALLVLRGRSTQTVAQVLYEAEHAGDNVTPRTKESDVTQR